MVKERTTCAPDRPNITSGQLSLETRAGASDRSRDRDLRRATTQAWQFDSTNALIRPLPEGQTRARISVEDSPTTENTARPNCNQSIFAFPFALFASSRLIRPQFHRAGAQCAKGSQEEFLPEESRTSEVVW